LTVGAVEAPQVVALDQRFLGGHALHVQVGEWSATA
jgi:hypothetical protein